MDRSLRKCERQEGLDSPPPLKSKKILMRFPDERLYRTHNARDKLHEENDHRLGAAPNKEREWIVVFTLRAAANALTPSTPKHVSGVQHKGNQVPARSTGDT